MTTIKIKGLEPTLKNLKLLQNGLDKELTNVLRGGGQLIRGEAICSPVQDKHQLVIQVILFHKL